MSANLTLKELLQISTTQLKHLTNLSHPDFRLEQAEYDKKKDEWDIVVSFLVENTNKRESKLVVPTFEFKYHRMYKRLRINSEKEILGFYIYNYKE